MPHLGPFTAFEHQRISVAPASSINVLSEGEADLLSAIGELRPGFCERGHGAIRLAQFCGVVNLGERMFEILPKVEEADDPERCRGLLLRLLRESDDFPHFRHLFADQQLRSATLLEVFIAAFLESVHQIVNGGLLRRYERREGDLHLVRGRVVAARQFGTFANRSDVVACDFDELTADHVWNQLVKAGLRRVRPWIANEDLRRRWVELFAVFDDVDDSRVSGAGLRFLVYDRQATRYRVAMLWVEWILLMLSPAMRAGESSAPGLLFDMNRLFESAVASKVRRRAARGLRVETQGRGRHLAVLADDSSTKEIAVRPDLAIYRGSEVVAIADTKWKRVEVSTRGHHLKPEESDIYQMCAYALAYGCRNVSLIYPWYSALSNSRETTLAIRTLVAGEIVVHVVCVDVQHDEVLVRRGASALFGTPLG